MSEKAEGGAMSEKAEGGGRRAEGEGAACGCGDFVWRHGYLGGRPEAEVGEVGVYNINTLYPAQITGILVPDRLQSGDPVGPDWTVTSFVVDGQEQLAAAMPLAYLHKFLENPYGRMLARKSLVLTCTSPRGIVAWPLIAIRGEIQVPVNDESFPSERRAP